MKYIKAVANEYEFFRTMFDSNLVHNIAFPAASVYFGVPFASASNILAGLFRSGFEGYNSNFFALKNGARGVIDPNPDINIYYGLTDEGL